MVVRKEILEKIHLNLREKANKLHDDRAYTACMASYALMCERRKAITNKKRPIEDATSFINKLTIRKAKYN